MSSTKRTASGSPEGSDRNPKRKLLRSDVQRIREVVQHSFADCKGYENQVKATSLLIAAAKRLDAVDPEFQDYFKVKDFLGRQQEVKSRLNEVWEKEDLDGLLGIPEILKSQHVRTKERTTREAEAFATNKAWEEFFRGGGAALLATAIDDMNTHRDRESIYSALLTINQSSGTGKSRTVDQLAKTKFTLPFNLREPEDVTGFPRPDPPEVLEFFLPYPGEDNESLRIRYLLFFGILFKRVSTEVEALHDDPEPIAAAWRNKLLKDETRPVLYKKAVAEARQSQPQYSAKGMARDFGMLKPYLFKPALIIGFVALTQLTELILRIVPIPDGEPSDMLKPVQLVMYFDESHVLNQHSVKHVDQQNPDGSTRTSYQTLCSALDEFHDLDVFSIFLSTNLSLSKYAPSKALLWSARGRDAPLMPIQAPFTELSFDVWSPSSSEPSGALVQENVDTIDSVCTLEVMSRFGRPLSGFWTRLASAEDYEGSVAKRDLIPFAMSKLAGVDLKNKGGITDDALLAAFSVRLLLEFEPRREVAQRKESRLVAGHMRLAYSVPDHREYMRTGYFSEPILAEAAAQIMKKCSEPAKKLSEFVEQGLIQKGVRGELVARLLLTRAHDHCIKGNSGTRYSRPIPLATYLEALFGETNAQMIFDSRPANVPDMLTFKNVFSDALIHFTHFLQADIDLKMDDLALFAAMCRGGAWKCAHNNAGFDIVIPVLLRGRSLARWNMSAIFVQVKNGATKQNPDVDTKSVFSPDPSQPAWPPRPLITLVMELGVQARTPGRTTQESIHIKPPPVRRSSWKATAHHPRFSIRAVGCSDAIYNVITPGEKAVYGGLLGSRDILQEHPRQRQEMLDAVARLKPSFKSDEASFHWVNPEGTSSLRSLPADPAQGVYVGEESEADVGEEPDE